MKPSVKPECTWFGIHVAERESWPRYIKNFFEKIYAATPLFMVCCGVLLFDQLEDDCLIM